MCKILNFKRRREANDVVSKKLGELLLKGYKMLDDSCEKCTVKKSLK